LTEDLVVRQGWVADVFPLGRVAGARLFQAACGGLCAICLGDRHFVECQSPARIGELWQLFRHVVEWAVGWRGRLHQSPAGVACTLRQGGGHIRHLVRYAVLVRRGIGRLVIDHVLSGADRAGIAELHRMSTLTAEPFYENAGFVAGRGIPIQPAPGISFPAIEMQRGQM